MSNERGFRFIGLKKFCPYHNKYQYILFSINACLRQFEIAEVQQIRPYLLFFIVVLLIICFFFSFFFGVKEKCVEGTNMTFLPKRDHNSILAIHSQLVKNSLITNYFHLLCNVICLCRHTHKDILYIN